MGGWGRAREVAVALGALLFLSCVWVFVSSEAGLLPPWPGRAFPWSARVDDLSAALLPLEGGLALAALTCFPKKDLSGPAASRILLAEAGSLGALLSTDLLSLTCFLALSPLPLVADARDSGDPALRRASRWFAALSSLPLLIGLLGVFAWAGVAGLPLPYRFDE